MRRTVLVLIREPILADKSEMGGGEDGKSELVRNRERASRVLI